MNLKYYLRGLGIGIIITALIMGITAGGKKERLTNEEIKERARALGMVEESTVLADALAEKETDSDKPEDSKEPEEDLAPLPSAAPSVTASPMETMEPSPVPSPNEEEESAQEPSTAPEAAEAGAQAPEEAEPPAPAEEVGTEETVENTGTITIQVSRGDGSLTVSRKLEEAGLIASASDFDRYLCQKGYDKRINVGAFEIPADAQPEQMAEILAGLK